MRVRSFGQQLDTTHAAMEMRQTEIEEPLCRGWWVGGRLTSSDILSVPNKKKMPLPLKSHCIYAARTVDKVLLVVRSSGWHTKYNISTVRRRGRGCRSRMGVDG